MFSSIRVRLTLWYLLVFGSLIIVFSGYIYSVVSRDMHNRFDASLLRTSQSMANYFSEFRDRENDEEEARETISQLKEGRESAAIFRDGQLLATNNADVVAAISSTRILETSGPERKPAFATEPNLNKRLVVFPFQFLGVRYMSAVFEPLDKLEAQIGHVRKLFLFGLSAALLLAAVGGFLLAQKSLAPMVNISEQAEHISARNLSERLKITNPDDELGRLAGVFNELLSRLDSSFGVMREFMADASHELRTPLTIIHGEAQVSLSRDHTDNEYRQSLGIIRDQAKRMGNIVSDMLALARADAGEQHLSMEDLYLNDLVSESCKAAQALATPKGIQLSCEAPEDLVFHGNEELLQRMIVNLIDNAIRYTHEGGSVSVKLTSDSSRAQLVVSDTGIGIPQESLGRVFDRFYRVGDIRMRANGGSGLGLSIVKLAAESHRGSVALASEPGEGSTFTVTFSL
jgi:two-component system OmpR family sensor kinase